MLMLRSVSVALQNARIIACPDGQTLSPSFQSTFIENGEGAILGAVKRLIEPISRCCRDLAEHTKDSDADYLKLHLDQAVTERQRKVGDLLHAEHVVGMLRQEIENLNAQGDIYGLAQMSAGESERAWNLRGAQKRLQETEAFIENTRQNIREKDGQLAGMRLQFGPHVFREECSWTELREACSHSFDGGILNLISSPYTLGEILTLTRRELGSCASLLYRATIEPSGPGVGAGHRIPRAHVILVSSRARILPVLRAPRIRASHLFDEFLLFENEHTSQPPEVAPHAGLKNGEMWGALIRHLFELRCVGKSETLKCDAEGEKMYFEFRRWCREFQSNCPPDLAPYFSHWPQASLRIALSLTALHQRLDEKVIPVELLSAAMAYLKRHAGRQLDLLQADVGEASPARLMEQQVDKLVLKLELHGPLTLRQLVRTYAKQDYAAVGRILREAILQKRVVQNGTLFLAADASVSVSGADRVVQFSTTQEP